MINRIVIFLIILVVVSKSFAQFNFENTYQFNNFYNVNGEVVYQLADNGYLVMGNVQDTSTYNSSIILLKTDSQGDVIWSKRYSKNDIDANSAIQTKDGGFLLTGSEYQQNTYTYETILIKTDNQGNIIWAKTYSSNSSNSNVKESAEGGYILSTEGGDLELLKIDSEGNILWCNYYTGSFGNNQGRAWNPSNNVLITNDNSYVAVDNTISSNLMNTNCIIVKADKDGNIKWGYILGGDDEDIFIDAIQTQDGGYAALGYTKSFGSGGEDVFMVKFNSNGQILWTKTYGTAASEISSSLKELPNSDLIISIHNFSTFPSIVLKTDSKGNTLWSKRITKRGFIRNLNTTDDNGLILTGGRYHDSSWSRDLWFFKTNSLGYTGCNMEDYALEEKNCEPIIENITSEKKTITQTSINITVEDLLLTKQTFCESEDRTNKVCFYDSYIFADGTELNDIVKSEEHISILEGGAEDGSDSIVIENIVVESCDLIPNIITPNNDGVNDYFYSDIFLVGKWNITIANRWGKIVYSSDDYQNNFNGDGLQDGTYYYNAGNSDLTQKGWFTIYR